MSQPNILDLIKDAPVEWKELGSICKIETGKLNANAAEENGLYMFFTTAKEPSRINKYRWDTEALLIAGNANVGEVNHYNGKFEAYQRTYVLTNFNITANPRFLFHYIKAYLKMYLEEKTNSAAMTYIVLSTLTEFKIPILPLAIQQEIVRILDTMTKLTSELICELSARQKQYNYYRAQLLSFDEDEMVLKTLGETASLVRGKRLVKSQLNEFDSFPVFQNSLTPLGFYHEANTPAGTTFIICAGAAGEIGYSKTEFWSADDVHYLLPKDNKLTSRYIFHFLMAKQNLLYSQVRRASIPRLSKQSIERIQIPIPPLEEQARIVAILDKFDTLTTSISEGLPREIELRQKQYEYYRDLLLSFPKPA